MLRDGVSEKIDEKSFIMHFADFHKKKRWPERLSKKIDEYMTTDGSKCVVKAKPNTGAQTVFIEVTIEYPKERIDSPNTLEELIKDNERRFIDFYNENIRY